MENFTPVTALLGGLLIGTAATLTLWANGRIAGISGILSGVIVPRGRDAVWRLLFVLGLLSGALAYALLRGQPTPLDLQVGPGLTIVAGLLVGFGTRLGSGCTSGHGICGLARFSRRSFTATLTFMLVAIITVFVMRHLMGGTAA
ncbi:MAG: YeeE/YedE family protein [Pseudomonadales bacterium]|nr:YeeE/YedE family protein [Pseudomonadales bacterium]